METWTLKKNIKYDNIKLNLDILTLLEELHLDVVLDVLLVVEFKFLLIKIEIDQYYWKIH